MLHKEPEVVKSAVCALVAALKDRREVTNGFCELKESVFLRYDSGKAFCILIGCLTAFCVCTVQRLPCCDNVKLVRGAII